MARVQPTDGHLLTAFSGARQAHWPEDLATALAHPIYGRLIRMTAVLLAEGRDPFAARRVNHRPVVIAPEPPHPAELPPRLLRPARRAKPRRPAPHKPSSQLPLVDRKRAAGGDDD